MSTRHIACVLLRCSLLCHRAHVHRTQDGTRNLSNHRPFSSTDADGLCVVRRDVDLLKTIVSITTAISIMLLYQYYWYTSLFIQISRHIDKGEPLKTRVMHTSILKDREFWAELMMIGLHCPPRVTFEIAFESMGNTIVYRIETLAAIFVSLR